MDIRTRGIGHFPPGVALSETLGMEKTPVQGFSSLLVPEHALLDVGQADALDPGRGAFEIVGLLAVELKESAAVFEHLVTALDLAQQIGGAHPDTAIAAEMKLLTLPL